jgi:hypothetical protein
MTLMLPSLNTGQTSLADVLPSCLAALGVSGYANDVKLPPVRSAVVVLVDGLGSHNVAQASAHARFLSGLSGKSNTLQTVFPSTTATALASLTTGTHPGTHGMLGYRIKDPVTGHVVNQLTGISSLANPASWLGATPLYVNAAQAGIHPAVVSHPRFTQTPLTKLIHQGANLYPAQSLDDRVSAVVDITAKPGSQLVVLYISELDECAHKKGVSSADWAMLLEDVDSALKNLVSHLPPDVGVLITADHGVLDIPAHKHVLYGDDPRLVEGVEDVGGEPRCLQIFFHPDTSVETRARVCEAWTNDMAGIAWVMTQEAVISQGLLGELSGDNLARIGDIWVLARKDVVFYDSRDKTFKGRSMIGQHGAMSTTELTVPLLRAGGFS